MKKNFALFCLLLPLSSPVSAQGPSAKQMALVLTHVTVIDTTGGPAQQDFTVVVRGDRTTEMGTETIARLADQGKDVSRLFTSPGRMLEPTNA